MRDAYSITSTREAARRIMRPLLGRLDLLPDEPCYRVSPRQLAPIVRIRDGVPAAVMALWFFWPPGAKAAPKYSMTNVRDDKLAAGWPWKLVSKTQRCLAMAGLWSEASDPKTGEIVDTFTIVTTAANGLIRLHDRMPVIIAPEDYRTWLEPGELPKARLKPYPAERMTGWRVSDEARNPRAGNHSGLIECAGGVWQPMS